MYLREIVLGQHEGNFIKAIESIDRRLQAEFYLQLGMWEKEDLYIKKSQVNKRRISGSLDEGSRNIAFSQSYFDFGSGKRENIVFHQDSN